MFKINKSVVALLTVAALGLGFSGGKYANANAAQKDNSQNANGGDIQREVLHELRMLPHYTVFDNLEFKVQGTQVTMLGEVTNPTLKSDAVNVVKSIKGVTDVTDSITVLPLSNDDDRIRRAEYHAIYGDSQLSKYGFNAVQAIRIIVDNGHVTLVGSVDSQSDKDTANIRAGSVPGTFTVTNNLMVNGER